MLRRHVMPLLGLCALTALSGCARRTLVITSEPDGALVWLNDREIGRTPVEVEFYDYGTYDVRLERDGFEPIMTSGHADAPWYDVPGPDLIFEANPNGRVTRTWHYVLEPEQNDPAALLDRANAMRRSANEEAPTSTVDAADTP
ncbi:MAG: PEGA domain-containing protein [Planctomycetota bacterium]